jgi:hypothetical protein
VLQAKDTSSICKDSEAGKRMYIKRQPPDINRSSTACAAQMKNWIKTCMGSHPGCRQSQLSQLPKRVLDVGQGDREFMPKLLETNNQNDEYVTLSYCWGPPALKQLRMTSLNLKDMLNGILMQRYFTYLLPFA